MVWTNLVSIMRFTFIFVVCLAIAGRSTGDEDAYLRFPEGFTVGAGGSAYQIEGGWNASDKGESIWDRFVHTQPWKIANGSSGDVASDSYHKYKEDVQWMKKIGLDHYRFSISWTRVLPDGFANSISHEGLRYYHNLIDELLAHNIEPIVTLYHFDHPQVLEDMGGWLNKSMVSWFADFADVIFRELGPKVKVFTTLNEPEVFCKFSYVYGVLAPGKKLNESAAYLCGDNALKAHARAYHLYDQKYRPTQNGKIGITSFCSSFYPKNPNETLAVEWAFKFTWGWFFHPIYMGDYHEIVKNRIAELNVNAESPEWLIPDLSPEWVDYINGTSDYYGLNHYSSSLVEWNQDPSNTKKIDFFLGDLQVIRTSRDPSWKTFQHGDWSIVPEGFGDLLRKIKTDFNNPPVYIMENGLTEDAPAVNDYLRMNYIHSYLKELLLAVNRDGCNVQKYTVWSLLDNFQWESGFSNSMGLINVNFSSPSRERSLKLSATWLQNVMRTRRLQPPIEPLTNATSVIPN